MPDSGKIGACLRLLSLTWFDPACEVVCQLCADMHTSVVIVAGVRMFDILSVVVCLAVTGSPFDVHVLNLGKL